MTTVVIVLIVIGLVFLIASYFIEEKLSDRDMKEIAKMSEAQLSFVVEKQVKAARMQVENSVEEIIDETLVDTKRTLEKDTNEKIMAISEYADTVLETINKNHNEVMFLYSMLNDKHAEITEVVGALQKYGKASKKVEKQPEAETEDATKPVESNVAPKVMIEVQESPVKEEKTQTLLNKKEQILKLHKEGSKDVEIAKTLDCGLGEVRLVLGLYKEEKL